MVVPEKLLKKKLQKREEKRKAKKKAQKLERQKQESEDSDSETKVEENVQEPSRKRKQQEIDGEEPSHDGEGVQEAATIGKKKMAKKEKKQDEEQCKYLWLPNCVSNSKSLFCSAWDNGGHVQHSLGQVFCVSRSPRVRSHHEGHHRDGLYSHDRYSGMST